MPQGKRKRSGDRVQAFFPDEVWSGGKKSTGGQPLQPFSLSKAWKRCGDGFYSCQEEKAAASSERTTLLGKPIAHTPVYDEDCNDNNPARIVWSSSDSELSNDGSKEFNSRLGFASRSSRNKGKSYSMDLSASMKQFNDDVPEITGWQYECDSEEEKRTFSDAAESAVEISDPESLSSKATESQLLKGAESSKVMAMEIAEYSSDDEFDESYVPILPSHFPASNDGDVVSPTAKPASEWLKTAQVLLQTPEKKIDKASKTPEDSAKKRKRFLRGGLAERLSRLQNRERSAISFWRHQCESDCKITVGAKSGVLVLKIIQVHEECAIQVAHCTQQINDNNKEALCTNDSNDTSHLIVLFTCQTAAQLQVRPHDIIHIHPPWQKLKLKTEDKNMYIILNTHFTQKIIPNNNSTNKACRYEMVTVRRKKLPLSIMFKINETCHEHEVKEQVPHNPSVPKPLQAGSSQRKQSTMYFKKNDSLLDVVESQGAAGWKGACLRVVVQRVYCLPSKNKTGLHNGSSKNIPCQENKLRSDFSVCLLVQDAYGMFSELHLQAAELSVDHIDVYSKRWEGKTCCLTGMKILQRTTKGRAPGLFSLIDSLWPPLVPIKVHGQSQDQQVQNNLPVPSFCYVLAVHAEEIEDDEAEETPDLYLPPAVYTLRDIHQIVGPSQRCSFCGTVIYIRPEISANPAPQQEMWIFVTDSTLQEGSSAAPRTLSVCISPSCLLDNRVHQALCNKSPCALLFKDAIRENGRVICVERTVLSVQKPLLSSASGVKQVTDPVQLDDLDCAAQANSLCAVQGIITGVNEKTAYSWPVCNECGSNKLQRSDEKREAYLCSQCCQYTSNPDIRMQLEVFLRCDSMPGCTVRIKLQQETISLLLRLSPSVDGCYEVSNVLGMKVGPLNCYVQSASSQLGRYVELKEISLWKAN
ncbi:hypothetical protein XENTR_v10016909 [Xenopus tropicalis]|uniref:DNA repair-scaffolding protein isoform X1 n=1 Tax=Xenopus tropicalis TaxID=8364 RepID=F6V971_XENTR|nr:DNA repair-scaffolding protein isoform X1 [Xenopus tropicalis]KAE8598710.1 hypothetical protein XENTR_v10016909 [Xenopus tropicalis]